MLDLLSALTRIAERKNAEAQRVIESYFLQRDRLEPVSRQELLRRSRQGLVTVIDVRPQEEFVAGHLPGAINIPLSELERQLGALPQDREVVAYCRGSYCVLSFEAVAALRERGYAARRLEEGFPEWKAAGLPVERTAAGAGA